MTLPISVLVILCFGSSALADTNYCDPNLCLVYNGTQYVPKTHVACNDLGEFGPSCPADANLIPIDGTSLQDFIVSQHNVYRGILARGELEGFLSAAKIPMMKWDSELAANAAVNAKSCIFAHDQCRNTDRFRWAGQNICYYPKTGSHFQPVVVLNATLALFFAEYKDASQSNLDFFTLPLSGQVIGHFAQMVHQRAQYVGCALVQYFKIYYISYVVCNYSYTTVLTVPVYTSGATCSQCQTECINGLCSENEVIILPSKPTIF